MRWSAAAPVTWPAEHRWRTLWAEATEALAARVPADGVATDGTVRVVGAGLADPVVRLVGGAHLQPGAEYRIAPELTVGVLRAWVGAGRACGLEWAPYDETGRAHVELQDLDRLSGVRAVSALRVLQGELRFDLDRPEQLLDLEVEVPWLRVTTTASVRAGVLEVEVGVRGLGVWWPTLAPLLLGARASVQRDLETWVADLGRSLTDLAVTGVFTMAVVESREQRRLRHEAQLREGMAELGRRQRAVSETVAALPWWRRTADRWRAEVAALPPLAERPADALVWPPTWAEVEQQLTEAVLLRSRWRRAPRLDADVARLTEQLLRRRAEVEAAADRTLARSDGPWLTDAAFDLTWLETPTRLLDGVSRR